jgi:hypothetical protein
VGRRPERAARARLGRARHPAGSVRGAAGGPRILGGHLRRARPRRLRLGAGDPAAAGRGYPGRRRHPRAAGRSDRSLAGRDRGGSRALRGTRRRGGRLRRAGRRPRRSGDPLHGNAGVLPRGGRGDAGACRVTRWPSVLGFRRDGAGARAEPAAAHRPRPGGRRGVMAARPVDRARVAGRGAPDDRRAGPPAHPARSRRDRRRRGVPGGPHGGATPGAAGADRRADRRSAGDAARGDGSEPVTRRAVAPDCAASRPARV